MNGHDFWDCECDVCLSKREDEVDRWLDAAPEREQAQREALDANGYYDNPDNL